MKIKELLRTGIFIAGKILYGNKKSKVLYYHDISLANGMSYTPMSTSFKDFEAQMETLSYYGNIVSRINAPEGQFMIAFDDGFKGVYDNKEFFIERGIYPTIFVAKDLIGTEGYMNESQIIELNSLGFNIQSHTVSHVDLTSLNIESLRKELIVSKHYLTELFGKEVDEICCPIGYYNEIVLEEARFAGYNKVFLSYPSPFDIDNFITGRYCCQTLSLTQFKLVLKGGMDILRTRYKNMHYKRCY